MRKTSWLAVTVAIGVGGCAHEQKIKGEATAVQPAPPPAVSRAAAAPAATVPAPVSPDLRASAALIARCKLVVDDQAKAPKFDFDDTELLPQDRDVLQQLAQCLTQGPLAGAQLQLVGRADPRGTEEYNLGLGARRAHTVATYLLLLGVAHTQLAESTRGALDAHGTDEPGWRVDRRVDLDVRD